MPNLRYLAQLLKSALASSNADIINQTLFLSEEDILHLNKFGCLASIIPTDVPCQYAVGLNRNKLISLCN